MNASFASRLGIEHPLIQAPMAGSTSPALVAAVSNAGALGSLGAGYLEPQAILDQAAQIRALGDRPYKSEEHTSELQSLMRISYAVFCLKKKTTNINNITPTQ